MRRLLLICCDCDAIGLWFCCSCHRVGRRGVCSLPWVGPSPFPVWGWPTCTPFLFTRPIRGISEGFAVGLVLFWVSFCSLWVRLFLGRSWRWAFRRVVVVCVVSFIGAAVRVDAVIWGFWFWGADLDCGVLTLWERTWLTWFCGWGRQGRWFGAYCDPGRQSGCPMMWLSSYYYTRRSQGAAHS